MARENSTAIRLERASCPRCGHDRSIEIARGRDYLHRLAGQYGAVECQGCGLWFQNPRPAPECLAALYPGDYQPHRRPAAAGLSAATAGFLRRSMGYRDLRPEENSGRSWRQHRVFDPVRKWRAGVNLTPEFAPGGRLLEIGCASGGRLLFLRRLGWSHLHGIELVPAAAEQAKAEGFSVACGQAEEILGTFPDDYFAVIIASMVLEHLYNPFRLVNEVAKKLKPGGQFLFSTVVRDSLDARIYGNYWGGFDFPRHMVHFRKTDIFEMLAVKFDQVECFHQNAPIDFVRSSGWRKEDGQPRLFDRLVLSLGESRIARMSNGLLALLGLTTRVSCRCRKIAA